MVQSCPECSYGFADLKLNSENPEKNLGNGWSKSIIFESQVVLKFDLRHGAKESGHLDRPLERYGQIYFDIFYEELVCSGLPSITNNRGEYAFRVSDTPSDSIQCLNFAKK